MTLLADSIADVPADFLKSFLLVFMCGLTAWAALFKKASASIPQPLITQMAAEFASAEAVRKMSERMELMDAEMTSLRQSLTDRLHGMEERILDKGEQRSVQIHNRIEPLSATLHDLAGQLSQMTALVHELMTRIPANQRKA